jgi:hypothetical protein
MVKPATNQRSNSEESALCDSITEDDEGNNQRDMNDLFDMGFVLARARRTFSAE